MTEETFECCDKLKQYRKWFSYLGPPRERPDGVDIDGRHIAWMCVQATSRFRQDDTDSAYRWLGFIEGWLHCHGYFDINYAHPNWKGEPAYGVTGAFDETSSGQDAR